MGKWLTIRAIALLGKGFYRKARANAVCKSLLRLIGTEYFYLVRITPAHE